MGEFIHKYARSFFHDYALIMFIFVTAILAPAFFESGERAWALLVYAACLSACSLIIDIRSKKAAEDAYQNAIITRTVTTKVCKCGESQ